MLRNYLKIALRTLLRHKGYSFINIAGLTIGLTCCLLIFQYVAFEYSFDRFHENEEELYRVIQAMARTGDEMEAGAAFTPQSMGPALAEEIPEVRRFTRVHPEYSGAVISNPEQPDRVFEEDEAYYVDRAFLDMFTFPLVEGSEDNALQPGTMLLSQRAAEKYFGSRNPIGEVLDVTGQVEREYRVAGVFQDVPPNSHLQFDFLFPVEELLESGQYAEEPEDGWSFNNFLTYVQLYPDADVTEVDAKMTDMLLARRGDIMEERGFQGRVYAQPLNEIYLDDNVGSFASVTGSYRTVYFFTIIGLVTLLIALVNYVNLATARALDRSREVGVRKVVGAERRQLIGQFLFESALTNTIAAGLAVALAVLFTPLVNNVAGTELSGALWLNPWFWVAFLVTFAAATLLAGLYPAFVLSSFRPIHTLKGKAGFLGGQLWLRRGLVVFQFAAAVVLIGGTAVVYNQLSYMRSLDLGLDLEQVVTVPGPRALPGETDPEAARIIFAEEMRRLPAVRAVATSWSVPGEGFNWNGAAVWRAENDEATSIEGVVTYVDTSFVDLYGLELVAGRGFDETTAPFGEQSPSQVLANETAVRSLGFTSPEEAIDHPLVLGSGGAYEVRIVGVLEDFNWSSAHTERQNVFFGRTTAGGVISLRLSTENLPQTLASIEETYTGLFPGNPFEYGFVDEAFDEQYQSDERFARLFAGFAGLAIFIACLGLFGLAAFTAQSRTKEIGVRKVLGATAPQIVALLSKDFARLVLVAFVIAAPVAYFVMQGWLEDFAYRINLGPGVFALAGLAALAIALLAVSYHAVKAALSDPAKSLRYE